MTADDRCPGCGDERDLSNAIVMGTSHVIFNCGSIMLDKEFLRTVLCFVREHAEDKVKAGLKGE